MKISKKHRILSLVLSFLMVLSAVPVTAFAADDDSKIAATEESTPAESQGVSEDGESAAEPQSESNEDDSTANIVATVNGTGYTTLEAAVEAVKDGETVTLLKNVSLDAKLVLPANKKFTLALDEYNITQTADVNAINLASGDEVIITGTGTITGNNNGVYVPSGATLTVDGATVKATVYNGIYNEGTLIFKSGAAMGGIEDADDGEKYYYNGIYTENTVTVEDGTVNAVYVGNGNVTVKGGTIGKKSDGDSFPADRGNLTITAGTVEGWMSPALSTSISGGTFSGSVFANQVTGGTFNGSLTMNGTNPSVSGATINSTFTWWSKTVPTVSNVTFGGKATITSNSTGVDTADYQINADRNGIEKKTYYPVTVNFTDGGSYTATVKLNGTPKATASSIEYTNPKAVAGDQYEITATVTAEDGYKFDGWYLNDVKLTEAEGAEADGSLKYSFTVDSAVTLVAKFVSSELDKNAAKFVGDYNNTTEFTITSVDEMEWFAYAVTNLGYDFADKTVKLANDLDFTGVAYRVVGDKTHAFKGTFDGQNKTISNISKTADGGYIGLFGNINNAKVLNLKLTDCKFDSSTSGYAGGIVAEAGAGTTIKGCTVSGVMTSGWFSGCVVGHTYGGVTVENVTVTGCSAGGQKAGNVAGYSDSIMIKNVTVEDVKAGAALIGHANAGSNVIENTKVDAPEASLIKTTYSNSEGSITFKGDDTNIKAKDIFEEGATASKNITVEAGQFTKEDGSKLDVSGYLPSDKILSDEGKVEAAVATVGGVGYKTLQEAIDAAEAGQTVTMLSDVTITGQQLVIENDKQLTLDLNGKTLKISSYTVAKDQVLVKGNLTIQDSSESETGTICSNYSGTAGLVVSVAAGGKLTMEGGTITTEGMDGAGNALKIASGAKVEMSGGTIRADAKRGNKAVNIAGSKTSPAEFIMTGGSVIADAGDGTEPNITAIAGVYYSTIAVGGDSIVSGPQAVNAGTSSITITGGNFRGTITVKKGSVSGGTFDRALNENACAAGFIPTLKEDGTYGVKEGTYVASAGSVKYESLTEAITAAQNGDTVTLLADMETSAAVEIAGKDITFDLNGKTLISSANGINVAADAKLTVKDSGTEGKVVATGNYSDGIENKGTLVIEGGSFEAAYGAVRALGGSTTTINGGTFSSSAGRYGMYYWANGTALTVTVNAGTFKNSVSTAMESGKVTLNIAGGTFVNDLSDYCADGFATNFDEATNTYVYGEIKVPDGYMKDENGNVTISDKDGLFWFAKQVNGGNNFAGKTVTLANDIDLNNEAWTPIGTQTNSFKGTFDGQNKTVSNINAQLPSEKNVGFFGYATNCTLKNLIIENVNIWGYSNVGGLAGTVYAGSTVTNVTVKGSIKISTRVQYVGGISGGYSYAKYENCKVIGDGTDTSYIEDTLVGDYTNYAGGIVGLYGEGARGISGCEVSDITIRTVGYGAGGITGVLQYNNKMTDCTVKNVVVDSQPSDSKGWAGTLAGKDYTSGSSSTSWLINNTIENTVIKVGGEVVDNQYMGDDHTGTYPPHEEYTANAVVGTDVEYDESGKITGGTFTVIGEKAISSLKEAMSADSALSARSDDDTYTVRAAVASVGDAKYATLAEAIAAAKDDDTVTLLADIEQNSQLTIDKSITLDLNGKTIKNTETIWSDDANSILSIESGAKVTITGNGTIDAMENDCYTINVVNGDLTIENGTFYGNVSVVQVEKGRLSVKGGHYDLHQKWDGSSKYLFNCIDSAYTSGDADVAVSGGTFVDFDPNVSPEQKVDGKAPSFAAPGAGITKNDDGSFTAAANMTAQILDKDGNSVKAYESLDDAIEAAKDGQIVKLLSDTRTPEDDEENSNSGVIRKNITIDLNQMTVTGRFVIYGEVTIQNGTIDVPDGKTNYAYGKLTLKDVDITGKAVSSSLLSVNYNGNVTLDKDSTIIADSLRGAYPAVFIKGQDADGNTYAPVLNIYGKVESGKTPAIQGNGTDRGVSHINVYDDAVVKSESLAVYLPQPCEVNITGGTVEGYCGIGIKSGTLNITGGTVRGVENDNVIDDSYSQTNGITYDGSAIMIDSYIGYAGQVQINISGGAVVESKYSTAIREIGNDKSQTNLVGLTVTGGKVLGAKGMDAVLVRDVTAEDVNISGGEFSSIVRKEYCAPGFVPVTAANADDNYGVEVGKFTVQVTSRTTTSDSPVANVSGGGSNITYATGTTVTASAVSGYEFVGWFVGEYTEGSEPYSKDLSCKVKPTDDCTMIAVYEPISGGVFALEVSASKFKVNGGATQRSYLLEKMTIGATVTVEFTGNENFLYWVNESGKVVSTSKKYSFSMGSATTLKAVYAEKEENQAMVVFVSHTQQVISSKGYTNAEDIQFPEPPIKMGATFLKWSMTQDEIHAAMETTETGIIVVEPVYESTTDKYTVTIGYPDGTTTTVTNVIGEMSELKAKEIKGMTFKCWKNGNTVLGYTQTLKVAPRGDLTLTAEYVDENESVERQPVITLTEISASQQGQKYAVSFTATRSVPEGYTVTEQGILMSTDSRYSEEDALEAMKLDSDGVKPAGTMILKASNLDLVGVTVLSGTTKYAERTVYGRAYMILRDSSGNMEYVYSDTILSGSYNSLTTNGGN